MILGALDGLGDIFDSELVLFDLFITNGEVEINAFKLLSQWVILVDALCCEGLLKQVSGLRVLLLFHEEASTFF